MIHETDHPDQDKIFHLTPVGPPYRLLRPDALFRVDNWVDRKPGKRTPEFGKTWLEQWAMGASNWALYHFLNRKQSMGVQQLPNDTEVVYGHVIEDDNQHGYGYLVHQIEIGKEYEGDGHPERRAAGASGVHE